MGIVDFLVECWKCLTRPILFCFRGIRHCCRLYFRRRSHTSSGNSSVESENLTEHFDVDAHGFAKLSPQSSITPQEDIALKVLSIVEEERSSQISSVISQQDSPAVSKYSKQPSPSPSHSKKQKKKDDYDDIQSVDENTFLLVKKKGKQKSNSQEKISTSPAGSPSKLSPLRLSPLRLSPSNASPSKTSPSGASPSRTSPLGASPSRPSPLGASPSRTTPIPSQPKTIQPRSPSPEIQPYKPKYTDKPSRQVESGISFAQVVTNITLQRRVISVEEAAAELGFKEPEPPREVTAIKTKQSLCRLDSSESTCEGPVIFQTESIVHRADSPDDDVEVRGETQPENIESNTEQVQDVTVEQSGSSQKNAEPHLKKETSTDSSDYTEGKEDESYKLTQQKTEEEDVLSPIDSSYTRDSREETGADDEYSESTEYSKSKTGLSDISQITTQTSEDSTSQFNRRVDRIGDYREDFVKDYVLTKGAFVPESRPHRSEYPSTIGDVISDILDNRRNRQIVQSEPTDSEPQTEVETLNSGDVQISETFLPSTSQATGNDDVSEDSSSEQVVPMNAEFFRQYFNRQYDDFNPDTIAITNYEEIQKQKLEEGGTLSPQSPIIEDLSEESAHLSVVGSGSSRSDLLSEQEIKIVVDPCSSDSKENSSSTGDENKLGVLGADLKDLSVESLEKAARQRNISCSETEEQVVKTAGVPADETVGDTSEDISEEDLEPNVPKKKKKSRKGKKKSSNAQDPSITQINLSPTAESLVSEEIEEEKEYIQEDPEVENQAVYTPDFEEFLPGEVLENLPIEETLEGANIKFKPETMPVKVTTHPGESPKRNVEKLDRKMQVRVLTLNNEEFQDSCLYRLKKNWLIEFRLGPTLFGRKIDVYCNFPTIENGIQREFNREQYERLKWKQDGGSDSSDDTALYVQVKCSIAGSFHYYFTDNSTKSVCGSGYFLVDPEITYGENEHLPLDCIQCQTVISKHLGSFSTWESKLRVSKESGYNMVHFTPVQELGASNSAYCLNDQLKLNPAFKKENGDQPTWEELKCLIDKMRTEWKVTSICDIVLNHTANESEWIHEHTEATYNCQNCKYMRPAYLLDAALGLFNGDVKDGMYETRGIPSVIDSEDHLNAMRYHLKETVMKELKLHELYICDVNDYVSKFMELARQYQPDKDAADNVELVLVQDPDYRRLAATVDMNLAMKIYNIYRPGCFDEDSRLRRSCEEFKRKLDSLNQVVIDKVQDHLNAAVENIISGVRYWRVQSDGPKLREITVQNPLITRYFTDFGNPKNIKEYEEIMYSDKGRFLMAHNGWIVDSDPLVNFARPESNVYIRRELIAWGDSVKLRYGEKPSDSPFLWDMMRKYVELTASVFDGVRLDNCHSTPLEVAEYLMDCARKVRPDLYVVAELFTNSDQKDNIFVNRLGITSLIREAMSACDSHDLGRLVYRYGGIPVGSFYQPDVRPLVPTIAHALFFDLTHDNPSPVEARSVFNLLPSAALVNMACCGTGSNRGYDELVPHQISVVDEVRDYSEWTQENVNEIPRFTSLNCGIIEAKKAINNLHFKLGSAGFDQVYVDQMDSDVVAVTRHCPKTHQSYILVAFTAFSHPNNEYPRSIRPLRVEGVLDEIILEATLSHAELSTGGSKFAHPKNFKKSDQYINGLSEYALRMKQNIQLNQSEILEETSSGNPDEITLNFKNFKPGSIVIVKVSLKQKTSEAVSEMRKLADQFSYSQETDLKRIIRKLELRDLNRVLYRCDQEERDEGHGFDTYGIPGFEKLVYAGLQGFVSLLSKIRPINDLGHPMCENIRQGDWMIDYIYQRLKLNKGTEELGRWIEENTKALKIIPKYLKPAYFDLVFTGIYVLLLEHSFNSMSCFVKNGSMFVKALSMGSIQFAAYIRSADLPPLSPNLIPPKPPTKKDENGQDTQICVSLSAGLPHFSVGYMRNWGRDTFIALRGLFLLTGRYQEARYHILAYGACLRHGLIPNLLDGGRKSRYNCRDAVWWWLYCIRCYAEEAPNGSSILEDKVSRIFPTDDSPAQQPGATDQSLQEVMQEALGRHFQGVSFRERNAGREIDEHMNDNGFNNQIGVHPETGFVFGGNVDNCGTWMDKMGSSQKAGNRGKPATPRDGSACEIVGLSKCVISWLAVMHDKGLYKYGGVERTHSNGKITNWSFTFWANKIQENFEKCFWINEEPREGEMQPNLINKRGIYKDCYGATQQWTDYQLRCNFPIVLAVAPELFNPQNAWTALKKVEQHLLGPLGMKTLDPDDWAYRADYDNSNDSEDASVANGFNYHQGPEWVWPVGFFLRAKLIFAAKNNKLKETIAETKYTLARHFTELQSSDWKGLPELTNSNGSYCRDSSRTQAWSMSCILEVLHDLQRIESSLY